MKHEAPRLIFNQKDITVTIINRGKPATHSRFSWTETAHWFLLAFSSVGVLFLLVGLPIVFCFAFLHPVASHAMATAAAAIYVVPIECLKLLWASVTREVAYVFNFRRKLTYLERGRDGLVSQKADVQRRVERGERMGYVRGDVVNSWLSDAVNAVAEANKVLTDARDVVEKHNCFSRWTIKLRARYKQGRRIVETTKYCSDLHKKIDGIVDFTVSPQLEAVLPYPTPSIKTNTSTAQTLDRVWSWILDDNVGNIGVWGMGGVGKTNVVRNINNKLHGTDHFEFVIFVTVSKNWNNNMRKLRSDIGKEVYLDLGKESEQRASRLLYKRLREKKFLLILDDVWHKIDLESLGVPSPKEHKGCKIVLTTRQKGICNYMETDVETMVEVLSEKESWDLFHEKAGGNISSSVEDVARLVCQECCGLPLAIITVGSAMRKQVHRDQWERALRLLKSSDFQIEDMEERVYHRLKFSYDMLSDDRLRRCFLYSSLFPEDHAINVQDLIDYWIMEGWYVNEAKNLRYAYEDGHEQLIKLVESCLLERNTENETVRMHDVIRDMAIKITSDSTEEGKRFWVKAGVGLEELVASEELQDKDKISLMENNISRLVHDLNCPEASTLFLQGNVNLYEITESFFQYSRLLSVLDLSATGIEFLPGSLSGLISLRALLLRACSRLRSVTQVGSLEKLQYLDLRESGIVALPDEIGRLTRLVRLNISYTNRLGNIAVGIIAQLSHLEDLEMRQCAYFEELQRTRGIIEELSHLKRLKNLSLDLKGDGLAILLGRVCNWITLTSFYLRVGPHSTIIKTHFLKEKEKPAKPERTGKCLDITGTAMAGRLVKHAQKLCVYQHSALDTISQLGPEHLNNVKECWVWDCETLKHIIDSEEAKQNTFPHLQILHLARLPCLRTIWFGHVTAGSFRSIREIKLHGCRAIGHVFSADMINQLSSLEELDVCSCLHLGTIVEGNVGNGSGTLPRLRRIHLSQLLWFRQLWDGLLSLPSLTEIKVERCSGMGMLPLTKGLAPALQVIEIEEEWWNCLRWEDGTSKSDFASIFKPIVSDQNLLTSKSDFTVIFT